MQSQKIIKIFEITIIVDNENYLFKFFIVSARTIQFNIILGEDFLKSIDI